MEPRRQISRAAIVLIKRFEGFRPQAAMLDDGRWTIGYGHTRSARGGASVSEADAEALLFWDMIAVTDAINEWTHAPLTQNQFDGLASFVFNIGLENFRRSTTLRRLNEGRMLEAAAAMELWRRADFEGERIVIDALVRRRASEKLLFLKPDFAWPAAPSPVLPPKIDYEAAVLLPSQTPTALKVELNGQRAVAERDTADTDAPARFHEPAGPSATEQASAAVSERLERLLGGESPRDIEPVDDPQTAEQTGEASIDGSVAQSDDGSPGVDADAAFAELLRHRPRPRRRRPIPTAALVGLGLIGAVLLFAAIRWGFQARGGSVGPLAGDLLGWGLGVAGIACLAGAIYGLLVRLSGSQAADGA